MPVQEDFYSIAKIEILSAYLEKLPANSTILDYGCGIGNILVPLARKFANKKFIAFDVSEESVEKIAELKLANIQYLSNEEELFQVKDDIKFDLIFSVNVFHHIRKNERSSKVAALKKIAKKGGLLIIMEHNPINPLTRLVVSRCEFDKGVELLGKGELQKLLKENSILIKKHSYIIFFPFQSKLTKAIEKKLTFLPLGAQHMVIGTIS